MGDRITTREQLTLVGLGLRTSNAAELAGAGKIAAAWNAFFDRQMQAQIPNQVHATATYVAFYDYQGEHRADYSYLVGAAVRAGTSAPEGMVRVEIPASRYVVFEAATPKEVPAVWHRIGSAGLHRAYTGDLEVYRLHQKVEIYVAVT